MDKVVDIRQSCLKCSLGAKACYERTTPPILHIKVYLQVTGSCMSSYKLPSVMSEMAELHCG